jgi:hypothetical protein
MVEHTFDDQDMTGYFLPKGSQQRLAQLCSHVRFLARLGQPHGAEHGQDAATPVGRSEWKFCLEQLAEQLDLVLQQVSWPAQRTTTQEAAEVSQHAAAGTEGAGASYSTQADVQGFLHGVTLDQIDKLNLLVSAIKAYGDAVFADATADFAEGTVSMLGYTIFDRANEVDDIVTEISAQQLAQGARLRFSVEEPRPVYGVQTPSDAYRTLDATPAMDYPSLAVLPPTDGPSLH